MRPENIIIGIILFGLVITIGFALFAEQIGFYGSEADSGTFSTALKEIYNESTSFADNLSNDDPSISTEDSESALFKSIYPKTLDLKGYIKLFYKVMTASTEKLDVPTYIIAAFVSIMGVLFTAFIIYLIRGFIPPKD